MIRSKRLFADDGDKELRVTVRYRNKRILANFEIKREFESVVDAIHDAIKKQGFYFSEIRQK